MATFSFVHYDPLKISIRKPSSKCDNNLAIDSNCIQAEALPALAGVVGDNNWCQKVHGDSLATIRDAQKDYPVGTQALIPEKDGLVNDIDDGFPPLTRLLDSNYNLESADEGTSVESNVGKGNDQALGESIFGSRGARNGSIHNNPIILPSDDDSEGNNGLDPGHACDIAERGQQSRDTPNMEHPLMLSTRTAHEHANGGNGINKTMPYQTLKRRRSISLPSTSSRSSRSLLPRNEDEGDSREFVGDSNAEQSSVDDICSKRRKVPTPQGCKIVSRNDPSQPSPPVSDDDNNEDIEEADETFNISLDARQTSSSRSTPAIEVTSPTELEVCPVITNVGRDWDIRKIIGKEDLDGVLYYLVDWQPTLLPGHSLGHAKELVDEFEARIQAHRKSTSMRGTIRSTSTQQGKKPRGRPRKQT